MKERATGYGVLIYQGQTKSIQKFPMTDFLRNEIKQAWGIPKKYQVFSQKCSQYTF